MEIKSKKEAYEKATVGKKIKFLIMPACLGLALVLFFSAFIMLTAISNRSEQALDDLMPRIKSEIERYTDDPAERNQSTARINGFVTNERNDINRMTGTFVVLSLALSFGLTAAMLIAVMKILYKYVSNPLLMLVFEMRKANEGLEGLGINITEDTEDEIVQIRSVYFKVAEQLKEHAEDVTNLTGLTEKYENSAHFDVLTGIYNRRRFIELVDKHIIIAAKKNEPTFVFMLDLDHFKSVNDTYGHDAGDEVLRVIAGRVKETVRPYDLFGRFGGEEFIMFISASDGNSAVNFGERVREIIQSAPVIFEGNAIPVTTSIGIAKASPEVSFDTALKLADKALYKAKKHGRNRVEIHH
jgi:diguanylate cyclase (GGDEF)-like protein